MKHPWTSVRKDDPCPICGKPDWCRRSGELVNCKRSSIPPPGWRLAGESKAGAKGATFAPEAVAVPASLNRATNAGRGDAPSTPALELNTEHARFVEKLSPEQRTNLAEHLGVACWTLEALGVGWATAADIRLLGAGFAKGKRPTGGAFAFPERDAEGQVVGITLRTLNGTKGAASGRTGSRRGLTFDDPACITRRDVPLFVLEGASDVAATLTLGLPAVGRPNNTGGGRDAMSWLAARLQHEPREVIIVGENDQKEDGSWPGREGAIQVAKQLSAMLRRGVRVAMPPSETKDIRSWLQAQVAAGLSPESRADCEVAGQRLLVHLRDGAEEVDAECDDPADTFESEPFPVYALPPEARDFVLASAKSLDVDPAMVGLPVLVAMATAIGGSRVASLKRGHTGIPAVIWGVIVSPSGHGKSPAVNAAFRPLRREEAKNLAKHEKDMQEFRRANSEFERRKSKRRKPQDDDVDDEAPTPPSRPRLLVESVTLEGLAASLAQNPRGVALVADELGSWMLAHNQYRAGGQGGDGSRWLSIFDAGPLSDLRKDVTKCVDVPRANVSIVGGVQPRVLRRLFGDENVVNGMLARFLLVLPPRRAQRPTDFEPPQDVIDNYDTLLSRLLELSMQPAVLGEPPPPPDELPFTSEASQLYTAFARECADAMDQRGDDEAASLSKTRTYALRMALVIHCARSVMDRRVDAWRIDADSIRRAVELVRYFARQAEQALRGLSARPEERDRVELVRWIASRPSREVSIRDTQRRFPARFKSADDSETALNKLVADGIGLWIQKERNTKGGPATRVLRLTTPRTARPASRIEDDMTLENSAKARGVVLSSGSTDERRNPREERHAHAEALASDVEREARDSSARSGSNRTLQAATLDGAGGVHGEGAESGPAAEAPTRSSEAPTSTPATSDRTRPSRTAKKTGDVSSRRDRRGASR